MPVCEACGQEGATKCCSGCKESYYCGIVCQKRHWKQGHKHKCVKAEKPSAAMAAQEPLPTAAGGAAQGSGGGVCASHGEECVICLDVLQLPQTLPCGHRFCRDCVASMREHGVTEMQVCPLCRGPMPDADRLFLDARRLLTQVCRLKKTAGTVAAAMEQHGDAATAVPTTMMHQQQLPLPLPLRLGVQVLLSQAADLCRSALAVDPQHAGAHFELGYALNEGGDDESAESHYRWAIAADSQYMYADAHLNLGILLTLRGDDRGAEAAYRAAIAAADLLSMAQRTMAQMQTNLGVLLNERGDKAGAESAYRAAIAAEPLYANAHLNLGTILSTKCDFAGAARSITAALKIDPTNALYKDVLMKVLGRQKREERDIDAERAVLADFDGDIDSNGTISIDDFIAYISRSTPNITPLDLAAIRSRAISEMRALSESAREIERCRSLRLSPSTRSQS